MRTPSSPLRPAAEDRLAVFAFIAVELGQPAGNPAPSSEASTSTWAKAGLKPCSL